MPPPIGAKLSSSLALTRGLITDFPMLRHVRELTTAANDPATQLSQDASAAATDKRRLAKAEAEKEGAKARLAMAEKEKEEAKARLAEAEAEEEEAKARLAEAKAKATGAAPDQIAELKSALMRAERLYEVAAGAHATALATHSDAQRTLNRLIAPEALQAPAVPGGGPVPLVPAVITAGQCGGMRDARPRAPPCRSLPLRLPWPRSPALLFSPLTTPRRTPQALGTCSARAPSSPPCPS